MVKFDVLEGDRIGEVRMHVEATFKDGTTAYETILAVQTIAKVFTNVVAMRLNVGIEEFLISEITVIIKLVFKRAENDVNELSVENLGRIRANFVFYLFALVDQVIPLKDVPFPDSFRYFLNLPETLANEYGWE